MAISDEETQNIQAKARGTLRVVSTLVWLDIIHWLRFLTLKITMIMQDPLGQKQHHNVSKVVRATRKGPQEWLQRRGELLPACGGRNGFKEQPAPGQARKGPWAEVGRGYSGHSYLR